MSSRIPLTATDEQKLLAAIASWPIRDRLLIEFGLATGFRARELCSVRVGHVWDGTSIFSEITVARRDLKGGQGPRRKSVRSRTVPLGDRIRSILASYLQARRARQGGCLLPEEPLFRSSKSTAPGGSITPWTINYLVKAACRQASLPDSGRWGSHSLRKSFCRKIYHGSGHDLSLTMAAIGHSDIRVTQRYLAVDDDAVRAAILAAQSNKANPCYCGKRGIGGDRRFEDPCDNPDNP
jgi:integrase